MPFPLLSSQPRWGFAADDNAILLGLCMAQKGRREHNLLGCYTELLKHRYCIHQSQHSSPQFYIQDACSMVHWWAMQQIHWGVVWNYLNILIFFFFCHKKRIPKTANKEPHCPQNWTLPRCLSFTCCLGMCRYLRKKDGTFLLLWGSETSLNFACVSSYPVKETGEKKVNSNNNNFSYYLLSTYYLLS